MFYLIYDPILETGTIYTDAAKFEKETERIFEDSTYPGWVDYLTFEDEKELDLHLEDCKGCISQID